MKKYNLSNDIELIIECCKEDKNTKIIEEKIYQIENWDSFIKLSTSHGVFPLIYHTLKEYQEKIPKEIFVEMKYLNLDIVKQNFY